MIETIKPQWPAPASIEACCTTRAGGVSAAPYESLNLALHVGDDEITVTQNRERLLQELALPAQPCWINQTHSSDTVVLELDHRRDADAAITRRPGVVAVVMTADCLPILVCNRDGSEVAAIHAGWRGLHAGVIQTAIDSMNSPAQRLMAWIGPGISQDHFEVGADVYNAFIDSVADAEGCFRAHRQAHWMCDLAGLATQVLAQLGIGEVYRDPHCSYRDDELFYSYRRNSTTGRMASLIWIR